MTKQREPLKPNERILVERPEKQDEHDAPKEEPEIVPFDPKDEDEEDNE